MNLLALYTLLCNSGTLVIDGERCCGSLPSTFSTIYHMKLLRTYFIRFGSIFQLTA